MFEDEIKKLKPFERYIISYSWLSDLYLFALDAYKSGYKFENNEHTQCYLDNIIHYRTSLKNQLDIIKMLKSEIDINSLDAFYKKELNSHNVFFDKIQILLNDMEKFLNKHNVDLTI